MSARQFRVRLIWLTAAALAIGAALFLFSSFPAAALRQPIMNSAATPEALLQRRLLRAGYVLDMLFLVAYGFLLRETARSRQFLNRSNRHSVRQMAQLAAILSAALMVVDAVENVLGLLWISGRPLTTWLSIASALKWLLAGTVTSLLGALWWKHFARAARHRLAQVVSLLFLAGALAAWAMSILLLTTADAWQGLIAAVAMLAPGLALLIQLGLWHGYATGARLLYLIRVPAGCLLVLAVFGPLALGPFRPFLRGLLDVNGWQLAVIATVAFVAAFASVAQVALVLLYGAERTGDQTLRRLHSLGVLRVVRCSGIAAALLFALCAALVVDGGPGTLAARLLCVAAGYAAAVGLVLVAEWLRARLSVCPTHPPSLVFAVERWPLVGPKLINAQKRRPPLLNSALRRFVRRAFSGHGRGYWDAAGVLHSGHAFALALAGLSLALHIAVILGKRVLLVGSSETPLMPTLAAITVLMLSASWLLSGLAFLLDRYRLPLLSAVLLLWFGVAGSIQNTDHVFRLGDGGDGRYALRSPAAVLAAYPDPIAIAAAGGGIQAATWTARVLQGLGDTWNDFPNQVAVLSTVSGGSVGALYFGAYLDGSLRQAFDEAAKPSLDEVAWGLLGPDVFRPLLLPQWRHLDRGSALEDALRSRMGKRRDDTIRHWANRAGAHFPAFLFNTTVVETGQPMAFATTQFPSPEYRRGLEKKGLRPFPAVESWARVFGLSEDDVMVANFGLPVATAARLSSAFPYVSPAARPWWEEAKHASDASKLRNFHVVDGGYYDNYGLIALTQWLDDALEHMPAPPPRVRVIVIRDHVQPGPQGSSAWTWARQTTAPPSAYLRLRKNGQWNGGSEQLQLLIDKWRPRCVIIEPLFIEYPDVPGTRPECGEPPLSWKLTATEKKCIDDAWLEVREPSSSTASINHCCKR